MYVNVHVYMYVWAYIEDTFNYFSTKSVYFVLLIVVFFFSSSFFNLSLAWFLPVGKAGLLVCFRNLIVSISSGIRNV